MTTSTTRSRLVNMLVNKNMIIVKIELPIDYYSAIPSDYVFPSDSSIGGYKDFDIIIHYFDCRDNEADTITVTYYSFNAMMEFLDVILENL